MMKIIDKSLTPIDNYNAHYEFKMDKPLDFNLLEEICSIKDIEYYNLDLYDDDTDLAQWDSWYSESLQEFLDKCKEANINIKSPLYWDLVFGVDGEDVNVGFEGYGTIYLHITGPMKTIEKAISIIKKIDGKDNIIKVVK